MRTKTKKGLVDFKRKRSLGSVVPLLFLATGFNVVSANGVETFFNNNYENDGVSVVVQTITGTIVDADGIPLPGATVVIKGTSKGTQSDFDGNFTIDANTGDVLEISYVGFKTQEIIISSQTSLSITLQEDVDALSEVVVVGYGAVKKSDLAGSVAQLKTKAFEEQPITRVEEALQGRVAGVTLSRPSGNPGADARIRVRGTNSITGNNGPTVIVDGIFGGDLRTINPNDIASIEVLKDASATAIYGSRGSNGVILVTTKKGKGKPKVSIDYFTSVSELRKGYENRLSRGDFARQQGFDADRIAELESLPDNEDILFRTAFTNNIQASVSGGSDKFNYFISGNFSDQEGILITNEYEKYSLRSNLESQVNDRLKVGLNLYTSRERNTNNPDRFNRIFGGVTTNILSYDPTVNILNPDGSIRTSGFVEQPSFGGIAPVPFATVLTRSNLERTDYRTNSNLNLEYKLTDGLTYRLVAGASILNRVQNDLRLESSGSPVLTELLDIDENPVLDSDGNPILVDDPDADGRPIPGNGGAVDRTDQLSESILTYQISNIINWNKDFGNHNLDVTAVHEYQEIQSERFNTEVLNLPLRRNDFFSSQLTPRELIDILTNRSKGTSAIQSVLGRVQYNFNQSLFVTASLRYDESSRFAKSKRKGYFPSAALAYSFKKLAFIENSSVLNDLKLRGSWGQVGNQEIADNAATGGVRLVTGTGGTRSALTSIVRPEETLNRNGIGFREPIIWETTTQWNAGFDIGFFNNRFNLSFDYFEKVTDDLLLDTPVIEGFTERVFENVGEVENKGFDISLYGDIITNDNFTWNSGVTVSHVKNEVTALNEGQERFQIAFPIQDVQQQDLSIIELNQPLGQFQGVRNIIDEDGNLTESGIESIGNGTPTLTWGFNNTFTYKNFDLNMFWTGSHGFDVYNQVQAALEGASGIQFQNNLTTNTIPDFGVDEDGNPIAIGLRNERYVEKGDFARLSNLSLGYTIKEPIKNVSSLKFTVSGQNLVLITDYSGYDPEVSSSVNARGGTVVNDTSPSIDSGAIPNPRTITFGVKLDF